MSDADSAFHEYLADLRATVSADALFGLLDLGPAVIPLVAEADEREKDVETRSKLSHIARQQRSADALPLLKDALHNADPRVWKEAIDGLVTLGSPMARQILVAARDSHPDRPTAGKLTFHQWIADAIEQLDQAGC